MEAEAEAEEAAVGDLHLVERLEALHKQILQLQGHGDGIWLWSYMKNIL